MKRVLIRADQSADWKIAGLRQLDRLALTLNEVERSAIAVEWDASVDTSKRWLPNDSKLSGGASNEFDRVFTTHQLIQRKTLECIEISSADQIETAERNFLRGSGKSQDGLVSRYLNRPLSRMLTQRLLQTCITPNEWSVMILPLVIVAALFLRHGSYGSILFGLLLFQVFSILDGCDGEIARAKFLESSSGKLLDDLSDIVCSVLLVFGLGLGLARAHHGYFIEGLVVAALIGINEMVLSTAPTSRKQTGENSLGASLYPRHHQLVENSGLLFLGERFAYWLIQLTKRDVSFLFFIILAAFRQAPWILHLLLIVNAISLALALKARFNSSTR